MKIIQWLDKFNPPLGGGPTSVLTLIESMQDVEFEVMTNAVYGYPPTEQHFRNARIRSFLPYDVVHHPKYGGIAKSFMLPYKVLSEYTRFKNKKKYLEKAPYDILHVNGPEINYGFTSFDRLLHKPFLQKITNFEFVNKPKVLTLHGTPSLQTNNPADIYNEKRMIEMFDNIICVEKYIYTFIQKYTKSINLQKNVWFIPNSVDTNKFKFTMLTSGEKLKVLFIGRLDPVRGLELIYSLIKNLPKYVELHMIGSGNSNKINKFNQFTVDKRNIKIYSNIPNELIPKYIENADIVLNPVKVEAISRISLESLSCGRPVIMLDKGDRYPTINGKTGYLIKENINELLSLLEYINADRKELSVLCKNARKIVENEFSDDVIIPQIKKIYEELMN